MSHTFLITGGAGFIGSALCRYLINNTNHKVINIDKLTYASNLRSLEDISENDRYFFKEVDICNTKKIINIFKTHRPDFVMHLAAESHVDNSISTPINFINSNILGTYSLLEAAREYFYSLDSPKQNQFRFHHISTDEVYGDLGKDGLFTEDSSYNPSSPYSASKASSDHLVRSWQRTYGLPTIITNCSNNYGPFQFPEKLIPLMILNAISAVELPIYGDGLQIRDWLYVDDHVKALYEVITRGRIGETYNIGGFNEKTNLEVVDNICNTLEELDQKNPLAISNGGMGFKSLLNFVEDRPGHDTRYAIDSSKIMNELKWKPQESFESGIKKTVKWYLKNSNLFN